MVLVVRKDGCPVEGQEENNPQKVEVVNFRPRIDKKKRNIIISLVIILAVLVAGGFYLKILMSSRKQKKKSQIIKSI